MTSTPHIAIRLAILHGSRATGLANQNSDWDVAVLAGHPLDRGERAALRRDFAERLHAPEEELDITDLAVAGPLLQYRAAMAGKLLQGSMSDFREFQIRAWKDYLNNEKIRELQAAFLEKALS